MFGSKFIVFQYSSVIAIECSLLLSGSGLISETQTDFPPSKQSSIFQATKVALQAGASSAICSWASAKLESVIIDGPSCQLGEVCAGGALGSLDRGSMFECTRPTQCTISSPGAYAEKIAPQATRHLFELSYIRAHWSVE
jgi:hypothetical protein